MWDLRADDFRTLPQVHGEPAAVLSFQVLYLLDIPILFGNKNGKGREPIQGLIFVSLNSGKIVGGRLYAANLVGFPGASGKIEAGEVTLEGVLERLTPQEYRQATGQ